MLEPRRAADPGSERRPRPLLTETPVADDDRAKANLMTVKAHSCMTAHDLSHFETLFGPEYAVNAASGAAEAALQAMCLIMGSENAALWMDRVLQTIIAANIPNRGVAELAYHNQDGSITTIGTSPTPTHEPEVRKDRH